MSDSGAVRRWWAGLSDGQRLTACAVGFLAWSLYAFAYTAALYRSQAAVEPGTHAGLAIDVLAGAFHAMVAAPGVLVGALLVYTLLDAGAARVGRGEPA